MSEISSFINIDKDCQISQIAKPAPSHFSAVARNVSSRCVFPLMSKMGMKDTAQRGPQPPDQSVCNFFKYK